MNARKFRNWLKRSDYSGLFHEGDSEDIQSAINGNPESLMVALAWYAMPQGSDFWQKRFRGAKLSKRTRRFLAKLRDEAKRRAC